jgi:Bax protein
MKKIQKKRKNKILETIDNNNLGSLARTLLGSLVVIFIFYSLPLMINFANDNILNTKEFRNNSKQVLVYTLDKKINGTQDENETFDERDLLADIYNLNDKETDAVRLNASTIKQLFEDTGYKLDDVRANKLVKPVALDSFPQEIKMIENTKKRKELFLQIVLPLVLQENNNIKLDRKRLLA